MRLALFLLIVGLLPFCFAGALEDALANYTEPEERVSVREFSSSLGSFYLVSANGLDVLALDSNYSPVVSKELVERVLREEFFFKLNASKRVGELREPVEAFNASRFPQEIVCAQYTGNTLYPCSNFSTCQYACIAVPLCKGMMTGVGDPFVTSITSWRLSLLLMDQYFADFFALLSLLEQGDTQSFSKASAALAGLEAQANTVSQNKLFSCDPKDAASYCFCPLPVFSYASLSTARSKLSALQADFSRLTEVPANAQRIVNETTRRVHEAEVRGMRGLFERTWGSLVANMSAADSEARGALLLVEDVLLQERLSEMGGLKAAVEKKASEEKYDEALLLSADAFSVALAVRERARNVSSEYYAVSNASENFSSVLKAFSEGLSASEGVYAGAAQVLAAEANALQARLKPPVKYSELLNVKNGFGALEERYYALAASLAEKRRVDAELAAAREGVVAVSSRARAYNQPFDEAGVSSLLAQAENASSSGDIVMARGFLQTALVRLMAANSSLEQQIVRIEAAKARVAEANATVSGIGERRFLFLAPDMTAAEKALSEAGSLVYSNPSGAEAKAAEAVALAERAGKSVDPASLFGCLGSVLLFGVLCSALACARCTVR